MSFGYCQDLTSDAVLSDYKDDNSGLLIFPDYTFDGQNGDLIINGTIPSDNDKAIDCNGNGPNSFYFGLQNEGSVTNINSITVDTILNLGKLEANEITITKQGPDAFFMNTGELGTEAEVIVNGNINVNPSGWVNNTGGALMTLNGKDAVIGAELANDYEAVLNINADTTINGALWNVEGAILNIADGVTVKTEGGFANAFNGLKGGTVNAPNATIIVTGTNNGFSSSETAVVGSISTNSWLGLINSGDLTVNNQIDGRVGNTGTITYNGNDAITGNLTNSGTIYVTQGVLGVDGDIILRKGSAIWRNSEQQLTDIEATGQLSQGVKSTLTAGSITTDTILNKGLIKANKITALRGFNNYYVNNGESNIETGELIIGNFVDDDGKSWSSVIGDTPSGSIHYGNSVLTIHKNLSFDSTNGTPTLENRDRLFLDGETVTIEGEGKLVNQEISTHWTGTSVGLIARNKDKDAVENLIINSEFVNQGEIYAKNLSVLKGLDGIEQEDGTFKDSHGFNVENLTVLEEGDFSLRSDETNLKNLSIREGGTLRVFKNLNVEEALSGYGTLDTQTDGIVSVGQASSLGFLIGSGTVIAQDGTLIQNIENFNGTLRLAGNSGIGVETVKATDNKVTLTLLAGNRFDKSSVVVGSDAATADADKELTVLSDGSLAIVVEDSYDGVSPLVTTTTAYLEKGASVYLYNATEISNGTTVIATTEGTEPLGYEIYAQTDNLFKVIRDNKVQTLNASDALGEDILGSSVFSEAIDSDGVAKVRVASLTTGTDASAAAKALNNIALMATAGAAQTASVNAANMITDTLNQHGSLLASYSHEKTGADLWIDLNGSFSKASGYKAGSSDYGYKSDLAGATIGADYAFGNGLTTGAAFSLGTGSVRGQGNGAGVKNKIDYWSINLYGVWTTPYANFIGNIGYLKTNNEISQSGFKGKPDVKTISVGVKAEKALQLNDAITVTPHVGIRYLNVDMDDFTAGGFKYSSDKANLVQLPFGVAFNANLKSPCGAVVKPFIDVQIAPAFGDRKASNRFALAGGAAEDSFEARIGNNAMYSLKIGVETSRNNHSFGLNYGIASGNYGRVDQALQAKFRYSF